MATVDRGLRHVSLWVTGLLATSAAAQPPPDPLAVQTVDGVTMRITKARWCKPGEAVPGHGLGDPYAKVFAVWYDVQAPPDIAVAAHGKTLLDCVHAAHVLDPLGRPVNGTSCIGHGVRCWDGVDPRWDTVVIEFDFLDPKAPPAATGEFDETLTFVDVPVPPEPGKPFDVGRSLVTKLGTRVFLDAVGLETRAGGRTFFFVRCEPAGNVPDLQTSMSLSRGGVVDSAGNALTASGYGRSGGTHLGRRADCVLTVGARPAHNAKTLSVSVRVKEAAESLRQEQWFRKFAFGLRSRDVEQPAVEAATPAAVHTDGSVEAVLESLAAVPGGYTSRLWIRDADAARTPGREWLVKSAALSDDVGTTYNAEVGWPDSPMFWKADGSPVLDDETGVRVGFGRSRQTAEPKALWMFVTCRPVRRTVALATFTDVPLPRAGEVASPNMVQTVQGITVALRKIGRAPSAPDDLSVAFEFRDARSPGTRPTLTCEEAKDSRGRLLRKTSGVSGSSGNLFAEGAIGGKWWTLNLRPPSPGARTAELTVRLEVTASEGPERTIEFPDLQPPPRPAGLAHINPEEVP